jgi:hypothetical protein
MENSCGSETMEYKPNLKKMSDKELIRYRRLTWVMMHKYTVLAHKMLNLKRHWDNEESRIYEEIVKRKL